MASEKITFTDQEEKALAGDPTAFKTRVATLINKEDQPSIVRLFHLCQEATKRLTEGEVFDQAHFQLGYILHNYTAKTPELLQQSRIHYDIAARHGYPYASLNLGLMLEKGEGGEQDIEGAIRLYDAAAQRKVGTAETDLADFVFQSIQRNSERAAVVYWKIDEPLRPHAETFLAHIKDFTPGAVDVLKHLASQEFSVIDRKQADTEKDREALLKRVKTALNERNHAIKEILGEDDDTAQGASQQPQPIVPVAKSEGTAIIRVERSRSHKGQNLLRQTSSSSSLGAERT